MVGSTEEITVNALYGHGHAVSYQWEAYPVATTVRVRVERKNSAQLHEVFYPGSQEHLYGAR